MRNSSFDDSGDDPLRAIRRAETMGAFTAGLNATGQPAISLPLANYLPDADIARIGAAER